MASSEVDALQDTADFSQDSPQAPLFASRAIGKPKSQEAPKGEVQSLTPEEMNYTPKELHYCFQFIQTLFCGICMEMHIKGVR